MATEFHYQHMFPLGEDTTEYYLLTKDHVSVSEFEGKPILKIEKEGLTKMANAAFRDVSFLLRREHNLQVAKILNDPEASDNDKYVALTFLRNAEVSAKGKLPLCQDTGTAIIHGEKGQQVWTGYCDEEALSLGVFKTYTEENLRYSQNAPLNMYDEVNTKCNLPAQIDLEATEGMEYKFLCVTKGGGSANKTYLYQETKAVLNPKTLVPFLVEKMKSLGTAACPPYHIAFVIGGTSAEKNLHTVKLASTHYYDSLPTTGNEHGRAFRDIELEKQVLEEAYKIGLGAQFGGKYMAHDVRIVRLPRHGASCPIGLGVSCSADRNIKCKINKDGIWIEKMDDNPGNLIPAELREAGEGDAVKIDLNQPMADILKQLTKYPVATRLSLNGTIIVGRDIAHAKLKERIDNGEGLPQYIKDHPIYYAGPAKTPEGMPCGSMGPTTAGRMDSYVDLFQSHGGSMIMLAKGNRSQDVTDACKKHGGFYLGSIGGPAAILAQNNIKSIECVEYPELGMEAIWKIEVEDFPAFILVDDKGNDFFKQLKPRCTCK
ncbi:MAG: fumarate hydratase [Paludibacteraceae bacterium]|nr:fumarate hydratase [Paludibacteraceae bacterium]MBO7258628.1 fumarate hydratase [Paludibacteraceae bacterium]